MLVRAQGMNTVAETSVVMGEMAPDGDDHTAPLDLTGTRRAPRFNVDKVEVSIDGKTATLVDLSIVGAQVLCSNRLRPTQKVRFTFTDQGKTVRIGSVVSWVSFEVVMGVPRYRSGIEFLDADAAALQRFIEAKRKLGR